MTDQIIQTYLDGCSPDKSNCKKHTITYAPSNIALAKYWGKRDASMNLPCNSSLSISLAGWGSETAIMESPSQDDQITFEGKELDRSDPFAEKMFRHVEIFRQNENIPLRIETSNSIPTAAGLASSASGFAALTAALNDFFNFDLSLEALSRIARLGSGSASRSLWHGFVRWNKGFRQDGMDSFATPLAVEWPDFRIAIIAIDTGLKSMSSRDGMNHTVATSPLFSAWPEQAENDCDAVEAAIKDCDIVKLGLVAEANALSMHATMQAARPSLVYLKPASWAVLETLWHARKQGLRAYATMDAGANVKLIFERETTEDVIRLFPEARIIEPFSFDG